MTEKDIIDLRVEILKIVYHNAFAVDGTIEKAKALESYVLGLKTETIESEAPSEDKVKAKRKA